MTQKKKPNDLPKKTEIGSALNNISEDQKNELVYNFLAHSYSGPLPHPAILKQFEDCIPGSGERILKIFEDQATHRQSLEKSREEHNQFIEKRHLENSHNQITKGQLLGFFICLVALISGTICSLFGAIVPGSLFGTAGVAGLGAVFVYGSKRKEKNLKNDNNS